MSLTKITDKSLASNSVQNIHVANNAITTAKIQNNQIVESHLATSGFAPTFISDKLNASTGYFDLPTGTTAQRPSSPVAGMVRYNTNSNLPEYYNGSSWVNFGYVFYDRRDTWQKTIVTNVTYSGIEPRIDYYRTSTSTTNITVPNGSASIAFNTPLTENFPNDTIGLILSLWYEHGGGATHGYWDFNAFQFNRKNTIGYATTMNRHYNDYYNTDWQDLVVPWDMKGDPFLAIENVYTYNSQAANRFILYLTGIIRGTTIFTG
jgi:hypothetical protein